MYTLVIQRVTLHTCVGWCITKCPLYRGVLFRVSFIRGSTVHQVSLEELCREEGLPWVDTRDGRSERDLFKAIPRNNEDLRDGLLELMSLCREAREAVQPHGMLVSPRK